MKKNPNFIREELILCLDLYFNMDYGQMHGSNPQIIKLSEDLRKLDFHKDIPNINNFRSINSISLKLANFKRLDGNFNGKGMRMGGKMDREIWNEFHAHRDKLHKEANLIRQLYLKLKLEKKIVNDRTEINDEFLYNLHKNRETDPLVVKLKKEKIMSVTSKLRCEVCGFDSHYFYGEIGKDLMEIHYKKELKNDSVLELNEMEDFIIVCSNCHKTLDKNFGLLDVADLKTIIKKR